MLPHMTVKEMTIADGILRTTDGNATSALARVNVVRAKQEMELLGLSAMCRYIEGDTHKRGRKETRGRKQILKRGGLQKLDRARVRLIKRADGEERVTYADVIAEASLATTPCQRVVEDALRDNGVCSRKAREKVQLTDKDAATRCQVARKWARRPRSYWTTHVHAYLDNKAFALPLTPAQRKRLKQTKVTSHLRKAKERVRCGFTTPRVKHSFLGMPSATVSAAVARDRVIMWHVVPGSWSGQTAATMCKGPLLRSLQRVWGDRRQYTIIEDGDRTGYQSNRGQLAKAEARLHSQTLPPRTPALMPLDYSIWQKIERRMLDNSPAGMESKAQYLKRLKKTAMALPRAFVRKQLEDMKRRAAEIVAARGQHGHRD